MVDSGAYPGDGEGQPPRKHRSGRTGTHDRDSEFSDERNQDERRQKRHRDRHQNHEERGPRRPREDVERSQYQEREQRREERGQSRQQRDQGRDGHRERDQRYEDGGHSRSHPERSQNHHEDSGHSRSHPEDSRHSRSHPEDSRHSRSHPERSQNHHEDGGHSRSHPEDSGHSRSHPERSQHHYKDREDYKSEKSYSQYQGREDHHKERSKNRYVEWERQQYAHSPDRRDYPTHSKFPEQYNPSERSFPPNEAQMHDLEYYEEREGGILDCHKCKYLCTGRGILQMLEVILNALVLICLISSYFVLSGFSTGMASGGFGGGYYPFEGQELKDVRQLDQEFSLLRAPLLYGGLAVTLLMGTLTLAILAAGSKHLFRLTYRWLVIEAAFSSGASLGLGAAVGVFLHFALQINATDVCKRRERLYARNGLTWMNCNLAGTDGGAATFAILLVILYCASAVLAIRAYREKKYFQQ